MKFEFNKMLQVSLGAVMMLAYGGITLLDLAAKLQMFPAWNLVFFLEVNKYLSLSQYACKKLPLRIVRNILEK